jgi:formylglycine-generating enzyme required for sulfatase activity
VRLAVGLVVLQLGTFGCVGLQDFGEGARSDPSPADGIAIDGTGVDGASGGLFDGDLADGTPGAGDGSTGDATAGDGGDGTADGIAGDGIADVDRDAAHGDADSFDVGAKPDAASAPLDPRAAEMKLIPAGGASIRWGGGLRQTFVRFSRPFLLDVHEVTAEAFEAWIAGDPKPPCAGERCSLDPGGPHAATMRWDPILDPDVQDRRFRACGDQGTFGRGKGLPINCVNYAQAVAYCHARDARLPTETEWYYAASGRGEGRSHPWGEEPPASCTDAIHGGWGLPKSCGFPVHFGSAPKDRSRDGILDLAGSLAEWVFRPSPGDAPVHPNPAPDDWPGTPRDDREAVVRGGSHWSREHQTNILHWDFRPLRAALFRTHNAQETIGFRCAKSTK